MAKMFRIMCTVFAICFICLGMVCFSKAKAAEGTKVTMGAMVDGEFKEIDSGVLSGDREIQESATRAGKFFVGGSVVFVVIIIGSLIVERKGKNEY